MRILLWLLVTVLVGFPLLFILAFFRPPTGDVSAVDAIAVLAGGSGERLAAARELADDGATRVLVLSYGPSTLCGQQEPYEVICFVPEPDSTTGEAQYIGELAAQRGWDRIAVATSTHHVLRARVLVGQCVEGEVVMIDAGSLVPTRERQLRLIRHEMTGLLAAVTVSPAC